MENKFFTDFDYYTGLINSNKNFAYARYADGEVLLMKGKSVSKSTQAYQVDKWSSPENLTNVGVELFYTLSHIEENYHYAISSISDNVDDFNFLNENIKSKNKTFANLWINANYQKMYEFYKNFEKSVYLICNSNAKKENFPFKVKEIIPFPNDCIEFWSKNENQYIKMILENYSNLTDETFFISAGPISEILIDIMYKNNDNNQYIDVGSSIDEFVHGYKTRPYMFDDNQYSKVISYF